MEHGERPRCLQMRADSLGLTRCRCNHLTVVSPNLIDLHLSSPLISKSGRFNMCSTCGSWEIRKTGGAWMQLSKKLALTW